MAMGVILLFFGGTALVLAPGATSGGGGLAIVGAVLGFAGIALLGLAVGISRESRLCVVLAATMFSLPTALLSVLAPPMLFLTGPFLFLFWKAVYEVFALKTLDKLTEERQRQPSSIAPPRTPAPRVNPPIYSERDPVRGDSRQSQPESKSPESAAPPPSGRVIGKRSS